jgi:Cytochrome P450
MTSTIHLVGLFFLAVLGIQVLLYISRWLRLRWKYKSIPGPLQVPLIGRIHDLPREYMWVKLKEWADEYGPIYFTSMLGTKLLVLSDEKVVEDLLVKRGKIYSDRPAMQSLVDSKSTHGTMEYLPLMGKNRMLNSNIIG